ncbi:MAG: hypothetical protein MZV70_14220 [Desulfobacterales bacterium]|nr:hypothetical protein [Desulfobacterales bacterium]
MTRRPANILGVFWDEDGNLIESFAYTVPADPECGIPEYSETDSVAVGVHPWDDELTDDENRRARCGAVRPDQAGAADRSGCAVGARNHRRFQRRRE